MLSILILSVDYAQCHLCESFMLRAFIRLVFMLSINSECRLCHCLC
jgi:hypothetical protein